MPEHQNEEWKESWRDEYLKWICGFANAQGGRIYIGMNDSGVVVGVPDYTRLLEDIPNKVQMSLGIMVDVNLLMESGLYYIEINVAPSAFAVNFKGEYHYRSGSTKQVLKGPALNDFLLRKMGGTQRWDAQPAPQFKPEELDYESFEIFRKAAKISGRVSAEDLNVSNAELLKRLDLMTPDGYLKRAAVLLFHRHPERLISGCYVKIALFGKGSELRYQEEIRGSLFVIAERLMEVIYLKYLTAEISYEGNIRVETYPYPQSALREIIYNALIHCNWGAGEPVYIKLKEKSLSVSNVCVLAPGWTRETLLSEHKSKPYNPDIANAFFRAGFVEIWGRGIEKVCESCKAHGMEPPTVDLLGEDITVTLQSSAPMATNAVPENAASLNLAGFSKLEQIILEEVRRNPEISMTKIAEIAKVSRGNVQYTMNKLVAGGVIMRSGTPRGGKWVLTGHDTISY